MNADAFESGQTVTTEKQTIRLGHSPDPDDAFMFYALAKHLIDCGPFEFEHVLCDIETLNQRAQKGELEITAVSIHASLARADQWATITARWLSRARRWRSKN